MKRFIGLIVIVFLSGSQVLAALSFDYSLPYSPTQSFKVIQANLGKFSHHSPLQYAVDFAMPIGTIIHAARGGIVYRIKTDSKVSGLSKKFLNQANFIVIKHDDETLAFYAHLQHRGAKVVVGDKVLKQQEIGLSGNTGYTLSPHLHFEIFKFTKGFNRKSIKISFKTAKGPKQLLKGQYY